MKNHNTINLNKKYKLSSSEMLNEKKYTLGISWLNRLLDKGIISEQDYIELNTKLEKKYDPILGSL